MNNMENTYWNENGKYQAFVNELEERMPGIGYTSNVHVNLFIAMSHLYYDAYNNGGGNIEDCYTKDYLTYIKPYMGDKVDLFAFIDGNSAKMEAMMDLVIEHIKEKDLAFPVYTCWANHMSREISMVAPPGGFDEKSEWFQISFGDRDELWKWARGYRDVSDNFVKSSDGADRAGPRDGERYYEIELWNFDENNIPERAGTVFCVAYEKMSNQDALEFCRDELGLVFEEVHCVSETTKEEVLEYYASADELPVFCGSKAYKAPEPLDRVIGRCEAAGQGQEVGSGHRVGSRDGDMAERYFMVKGFDKDRFLRFLSHAFPEFNKSPVMALLGNLVDYTLEHCHHSLDQACYFLSDLLPDVDFADVAIFMDDSMLTHHGREVKYELLEELRDPIDYEQPQLAPGLELRCLDDLVAEAKEQGDGFDDGLTFQIDSFFQKNSLPTGPSYDR